MSEKNREFKLQGIILKKRDFRDTSLILDVFTPEFGMISLMAKGVKNLKSRSTGLLEQMNELDFVLYKNPVSEWYIYKNSELLSAHLLDTNYQTAVLMSCAAEIYQQLILEKADFIHLYELLKQYLDYIRSVPINGVAVFWRFLLRMFQILGIHFDISNCSFCDKSAVFAAYYPQKHGFICKKCYLTINRDQIFPLTTSQAKILSALPHIGNVLSALEITNPDMIQINNIFLTHLSEHFHKRFHLKTQKMLLS